MTGSSWSSAHSCLHLLMRDRAHPVRSAECVEQGVFQTTLGLFGNARHLHVKKTTSAGVCVRGGKMRASRLFPPYEREATMKPDAVSLAWHPQWFSTMTNRGAREHRTGGSSISSPHTITRTPAIAVAVLLTLWSASATADPITLTSGVLIAEQTVARLHLDGLNGFRLDAGGSAVGGIFPIWERCASHECKPGQTVPLTAAWSGTDFGGSATVDGITFNLGLQTSATARWLWNSRAPSRRPRSRTTNGSRSLRPLPSAARSIFQIYSSVQAKASERTALLESICLGIPPPVRGSSMPPVMSSQQRARCRNQQRCYS